MYNFPYETPTGSSYPPDAGPRRPSLLRMVVAAVLIGVVASLIFGSAVWAVGFMFHLIGFFIRLAVLAAIASFIWRRVVHRHAGRRSYNP